MILMRLLIVGVFAAVIWRARRVPLAGWRRGAVAACHLAAMGAVCAALWGAPRRATQQVARRVVYLVDRSASIDDAQRAWSARRVASLEALRPPAMPRALVAFGADTRLAAPFGRERLDDPQRVQQLLEEAAVDPARTNLEAALLVGASLLPPRQQGGLLLFSDGRETAGNAGGILGYLGRVGVRVAPQPPPVSDRAAAMWDALWVPPTVQRGATVPVKLVVFNAASAARPAEATVAVQGVPLKRQRLLLRPGWQVVTVPVRALVRGTMAMDVQLAVAGQAAAERRMAYTEVEGPPQILLIAESVGSLPALAQALKRRGMELAVMRPAEVPSDAGALATYDALLTFNVPKSVFSEAQAAALRRYVEASGGGLVTVGLGGSLAEELRHPAPLDALLPVTFEAKGAQEAKRRVCFVMLIDRSASMLGPRIAATKRAAVELVKQLQPEDLVGVLAFDTEAYIVAEVQPAGQIGPWLVEKLVKLRSTGGTDIYPALSAAANRLEATGATTKHIVLLSDGNTPFHEKAYGALIKSFQQNGTTISTIGIGPAFVNTDFLRWLAGSTNGAFYLMRSPDELPRLVAQDTQQELGKLPFTEGYFRPVKTPASDWFGDLADWPTLRGFLTATAKPESLVDLTIDGGGGPEPLLARWTLGRGRVASFLSDADTRWSPDWIRWNGFDAAWAQILRWAVRPQLTEELFVWMDESHAPPRLMLEGLLEAPTAELLSADPSTPPAASGRGVAQDSAPRVPARIPLSLMQTGAWRWQAVLDQVPGGWYQLSLESGRGTSTVFAKRWIQVGTPPQEAERAGQPPQETLLREVAQATGGLYDMPDEALLPPTARAVVTQPLFMWWLPLTVLLLLVEVALRGSSML